MAKKGTKMRSDGRLSCKVTYELDGIKKQKFIYAKTDRELQKLKKEFLMNVKETQHTIDQGIYFEQAVEEWYDEIESTVSPTTLNSYKANKKDIIKKFGDKPIKEITPLDISNYLFELKALKLCYKTVLSKLQTIRQVYDYSMLHGYIQVNNAMPVKMPRGLTSTKREVPNTNDINKIKNSVGKDFSLFALMALYTGCRRGEILALQWSDIDFNNKNISINKSLYFESNTPHIKQPKTRAGVRIIPLLKPLEEVLTKAGIQKSGYIIHKNGKPLTHRNMISGWKKYASEIGIAITPHQLRHAFATRLYELDVDEKAAQEILGHADITTTRNIYTHIRDEKYNTVRDQLDGF